MVEIPTACITCGRPVYGRSRCPEHSRGNWTGKSSLSATYNDPIYLKNRKTLLEGNPLCVWCGRVPATTADHLIAVAQGGTNDLGNLVPACEPCNRLRGASLGGRVTKARRLHSVERNVAQSGSTRRPERNEQ
jgi:5-methylcytosine-specific restriction endonuclease McrA